MVRFLGIWLNQRVPIFYCGYSIMYKKEKYICYNKESKGFQQSMCPCKYLFHLEMLFMEMTFLGL